MSIVEDQFRVMMTADEIVGERVMVWMKRRGLTGVDVATHLGISRQSVSRKCGGHVSWSLSELARLAHLLVVPLSELVPEDLVAVEQRKLASAHAEPKPVSEPPVRLELTTFALQERRSTN